MDGGGGWCDEGCKGIDEVRSNEEERDGDEGGSEVDLINRAVVMGIGEE